MCTYYFRAEPKKTAANKKSNKKVKGRSEASSDWRNAAKDDLLAKQIPFKTKTKAKNNGDVDRTIVITPASGSDAPAECASATTVDDATCDGTCKPNPLTVVDSAADSNAEQTTKSKTKSKKSRKAKVVKEEAPDFNENEFPSLEFETVSAKSKKASKNAKKAQKTPKTSVTNPSASTLDTNRTVNKMIIRMPRGPDGTKGFNFVR